MVFSRSTYRGSAHAPAISPHRHIPIFHLALIVPLLSLAGIAPCFAAAGDKTADRVLGQPTFATGNAGTNGATFNDPWHAAVHSGSGRIYVADKTNNRVLSWPNAATFANGATADKVFGQAGSLTTVTSNTGGLSASSLNAPVGVAVDSSGNVYIADTNNNRILIYDNPSANDTVADRVLGQSLFTGANFGTTATSLSIPSGLCIDASGNVYVADRGNSRILKYNTPISTNKAASLVFGQSGSFTTSVAAAGAGGLSGPEHVATDGATVFIVDTANNRVLQYTNPASTDTVADKVFGQPDFSTTSGAASASKLSVPYSAVVDTNGTLYVADRANSRVLAYFFAADGDTVADFVFGPANFTTASPNQGNANCSQNTLFEPRGVALDGNRNLYIIDSGNFRVLGFDTPIPNPAPSITSLNPSAATAGGGTFALTVNGNNFISSSSVKWNDSARTTTFVSSTQLTATITATDINLAVPANLTVVTGTPGGGTSAASPFTVNNPAPTASLLTPTSATAGDAAFSLAVDGANFVSATAVYWNGSPRPTQYTSSSRLSASISAADMATGGTCTLTVINSTPGGGTSQALSFTVNNPVPAITSISPNSATIGTAAFMLTVNGANFVSGVSTVRWDGADRTTTFVSNTQLTATIAASDAASEGTSGVTVFNPAPAGGTTTALNFIRQLASTTTPPAITSSLTAAGSLSQTFSYTITASHAPTSFDATGLPLGLSLNTATGLITGTPGASGDFPVTISALNAGGKGSATLALKISPRAGTTEPGVGAANTINTDSDGDGFNDEIENALQLNPADSSSTPFGGSSAGATIDLVISKIAIKLNFAKPGVSDSISLSGTLPVKEGFVVKGQSLTVDVGGAVQTFEFSEKGAAKKGDDSVKFTARATKGVVAAQLGKYSIKFNKGSFTDELLDEGLANATLSALALKVPVIILFDQKLFRGDFTLLYTAKKGKTGKTQQPR